MNHCLLEIKVKKAPTVRFTQDNKTPLAEMEAQFDSLRADDPPGEIKVVGWGKLAEELQSKVEVNANLIIEGRLRMNTVTRQDGIKEKRAEFTLSRFHKINNGMINHSPNKINDSAPKSEDNSNKNNLEDVNWNSAPLVPDTDDIPF